MEEEKFEIHIKGGFSERKKLKSFSDIVQKIVLMNVQEINYFQ